MANSNVAVHGNDGWNVAVNAPIKNMVFYAMNRIEMMMPADIETEWWS